MNKNLIKIIVFAVICAVFIVLLSVSGCQTQKLKKANQEYKEQNEQFKASNEQLRAQIDSLNNIAEQIRTENLVFKESNEILSQNLKDLKVENANFIVENERLKAHIASLDDLTKRFDELLQRLDTEVSRIEKIK